MNGPPLLADAAETTAFVHASIPPLARFGVSVASIGPGIVELRMPLEGNANHMGTMYAGALFAVAELPGGVLPWTVLPARNVVPIAKQASVRYRRPARSDVVVVARMDPAEILALAQQAQMSGKADFQLNLSVLDDEGTEVMVAETLTQLRRLTT